jgi:hypothetical protein
MAFKPNYNQARSERDRAKAQKKQAKLQKREEDAAKRKGVPDEDPPQDGNAAPSDTEPSST